MPPSPGSPAFRLPWRVSCRGLALNREESGGASVPTSPLWGPPDNTKALCRGRLPPVIPISVPVQVIKDLKGSDYSWSYQTPPSSPSGSGSRKSSMCSAPSSSSSAKGGGAPWPGGAHTYSPGSTCRYRSLAQPAAARLSSVSSHDSGFVSQDATYSKPPSPMPSDITSQVRRRLHGLQLWHLASPGPTWLRTRVRAAGIRHSGVSGGVLCPTCSPFPDSLPTAFFQPREPRGGCCAALIPGDPPPA